MDKEKSCE